MEGLTDRQAADAVRDRLAWKYALSLELTDPGFEHSVLSEFRSRLLEGNAQQRMPGSAAGALSGGGMAEPLEDGNATCSTHGLAKIRAPKCTLCVGQSMV
jgi:transposase